jgi:hypothetical protein
VILFAAVILVAIRVLYSLAEICYERDWPRSTWRGLMTALMLLFLCGTAFGQAVRVDQFQQTYGPNVPSSGGPLPQTLWVANATALVCAHPSSTYAACQANPVTTYTDSTESTPCLSSTPLVLLPGNTCTASTGVAADVGFWYQGGLVDYWVVTPYGNYGPYTLNSGATGGNTGTLIDACLFPGTDLGAKIIAAYTANPAPALITARPCVAWTTPLPAFPSGDGLYLQAGFYNVPGGNKLLGNNHIYGDGFVVTTLLLQNNDSSGMMWQMADGATFAASNVQIDSLTLDGNKANQTVTAFGTGLIWMGSNGPNGSATASSQNIQIAAQLKNCKVSCISVLTSESAPYVSGLVMTGSHISGSGQSAVFLDGASAPIWVGLDISGWGLDTPNNDAIFAAPQLQTGGSGCASTALGPQWIGGVLNNTAGATKFGIEDTPNTGCGNFLGGTIKGITSYGAPTGGGGNGFSTAMDNAVIEGNSIIPPAGVTTYNTGGGMELSLTNSAVSNNTVIGGTISLSNTNTIASHDVQFANNIIKPQLLGNPSGLILGGGGTGQTNQHITVTGGDIDLTGFSGVDCNGILIGKYAGVNAIVNDVKIEGVNIHQDSGAVWNITSWSISGNVATFQGSFTGMQAQSILLLGGFGTSAFFNSQRIIVNTSGLTSTQFTAAFTHANGSATEAGLATGALNVCHGVFSNALDGSATMQVRHNTFTNLLGALGDEPNTSIGMTDIDMQDNTLRGNTPFYDNYPPVTAVNIRQVNNNLVGTDLNQYLEGGSYFDQFGFGAFLGGAGSGDVNSIPQSNLIGWYAASSVCPNASLSAWTDLSGNGNTLTAGGGTYGVCVPSDINGYPAVRFVNGTTYPYVKTGGIWPFFGYSETVFVVHKKTTGTTGVAYDGGPPCFSYCGSGVAGQLQYTSATVLATDNNGSPSVSGTVVDDGLWHIDVVQQDFATQYIQILHDGTQVASLSGGTVDGAGLSGISIGGVNSSALSSTTTGDIAEVMAFSTKLTSTQNLGIETYLAYKYGLTINGTWSIVNGALQSTSVETGSIIDTGVATSPSTSPICPNGTGGAFTTSGCFGGGSTLSGDANGPSNSNTVTGIGGTSLTLSGSGSSQVVGFAGAVAAATVYPLQIGTIYYLDSFVQKYPSGGTYGGAWSAGTYSMCQSVTYSGVQYVSGVNNNSTTPGTGYGWMPTLTATTYAPTAYDCALAAAYTQINSTGLGYKMEAGSALYPRCLDTAWPYDATNGATLSLEGVPASGTQPSGGSQSYGQFPSTVIQQSSSCASTYPMVYVPGTQTPFTAPHFRNVTFDANTTSPAFGYIANTYNAEFDDVVGINPLGGSWTGAPTVHGAALTGGWLLGSPSAGANYLTRVNGLQSYMNGTVMFIHAVSNGAGNAWGQITVSGTLGSVTAATGGSLAGTGTVLLSGFNNGCTGSTATVTITSGAFTSAVVTAAGTLCSAAPTTASCASGSGATCSGTVTVTSTTTANYVSSVAILSICNASGYNPGAGSSPCTGLTYKFIPKALVPSPICATAPSVTPTYSGSAGAYSVTGLTLTSAGSCPLAGLGTNTLAMYIMDEPTVAYGIYFDVHNAFIQNILSNFGTTAGIADETGSAITYAHWYFTPGFIDYTYSGTYTNFDMDSSLGYNFNAAGTGGKVTIISPYYEYNGFPVAYGMVNSYVAQSGEIVSVVDPTCRTAPSGTYIAHNFDYFTFNGSLDSATNSTVFNPFHVVADQVCFDNSRTAYDVFNNKAEVYQDNQALSLGRGSNSSSVWIEMENTGGVGYNGSSSGIGLGAGLFGGANASVLFDPNYASLDPSHAVAGYAPAGSSGSGSGLYFERQGTAIASASTIAPILPVYHVTGTTAIATITVPSACVSGFDCNVGLIADGIWTTTTGGNIAVAITAIVGYRYDFTYDPGTSKWYPKF